MSDEFPRALAGELFALGTATLSEAARRHCALPCSLRPVWPGAAVAGWALPVRTEPRDNLPLHRAVELAAPGEVLVVDGRGARCGYWGEVLTVAALERGVAGLVIDGGVRDTDALARLRFPVFCSAVAVPGTEKRDPGTVGEPISLGEVPVHRGDVVVGDADAVVVLPRARLDEVLAAARERQAAENRYLARIRSGESTVEIYGLRR